MLNKIRLAIAGLMLSFSSISQAATIELALLLDGSGSVTSTGWALQRDAYKNIFSSGSFYTDNVLAGDTLVVSAMQFGSTVSTLVGTHVITDNASATTFGNAFTGLGFPSGSSTQTDQGVDYAHNWITTNGYSGDRLIIDVSTDGNPCCTSGELASAIAEITQAAADGIVTNFIGVGTGVSITQLNSMAAAGNGFVKTATSFATFETALEEKLFREITGVPAPATLALFGLGLIGFGLRRKTA